MDILGQFGVKELSNDHIITGFFCVELLQKDSRGRGLMGAEYTYDFKKRMRAFK